MTQSPAPHLVLASASPRRRELIQRLGLAVTIQPANIDEESIERALLDGPGANTPELLAPTLASAKAAALAGHIAAAAGDPETMIIGADTTVILDGKVLGKPADVQMATAMLSQLRGRTHTVVTGLATRQVAAAGRQLVRAVATPVTMRTFSDAEMAAYIATGDPFDKAGAYAIQHPIFQPVARINGCATGVIGLPLCALAAMLRESGITIAMPDRQSGAVCRWDGRCTQDGDLAAG